MYAVHWLNTNHAQAPFFAYMDQHLLAFLETDDTSMEGTNQMLVRTHRLRSGANVNTRGVKYEPTMIRVPNEEFAGADWIMGSGKGYGITVARAFVPKQFLSYTEQSMSLKLTCPIFFEMLTSQFPETETTTVLGTHHDGAQEIEVSNCLVSFYIAMC